MSHSTAYIKTQDNVIYYGEYNGTVDGMLPNIYETYDEMQDNWRKQMWRNCLDTTHIHKYEDARLCCTYGSGYCWDVVICRECKLIVDYFAPHNYDENDNPIRNLVDFIEDWIPNYQEYKELFK